MEISKKGKAEIAQYEGCGLTKYLDSVDVWTIAFGATSSEIIDLRLWPYDKSISLQEAFKMFNDGLVKYSNAVSSSLKVEVNQEQFDALCSITYNIGISGMHNSTFMRLINQNGSNFADVQFQQELAGSFMTTIEGVLLSHLQDFFDWFKTKSTPVILPQHPDAPPVVVTQPIPPSPASNPVSTETSVHNETQVASAIMQWTKQKELVGRRMKEATLFTKGIYSNNGTALLFPVSTVTHKPIYSQGKSINVMRYL